MKVDIDLKLVDTAIRSASQLNPILNRSYDGTDRTEPAVAERYATDSRHVDAVLALVRHVRQITGYDSR